MLSSVDGEGTTPGCIFIELLPRIALNRTRSLILGGLCPPNPLGFTALLPKQGLGLQIKEEGQASVPAPPLLRPLSRRSGRVPALPYPPLRPPCTLHKITNLFKPKYHTDQNLSHRSAVPGQNFLGKEVKSLAYNPLTLGTIQLANQK
jgi:hypothetical protein